jgi:hypothetical protein
MNRLLLLAAIEESALLSLRMLDAVVTEMTADQTRGARAGGGDLRAAPDPVATPISAPAPANHERLPVTEVAALLAERDARTAELEAAIGALQAAGTVQQGEPLAADDTRLAAALERIEARLEEQEQSFRHVLTMLIEWFEEDPSRRAA